MVPEYFPRISKNSAVFYNKDIKYGIVKNKKGQEKMLSRREKEVEPYRSIEVCSKYWQKYTNNKVKISFKKYCFSNKRDFVKDYFRPR